MDAGQMRVPDAINESHHHRSTATLLISAKAAAAACGKSLRTWRAWDAAGWIPRPVRIGRSTLWRADELRAWVEAGCPRRDEWEAMRGREISPRSGHLPGDRIASETRTGES